ncbi:hypothetical protein AAGS40_25055 (plasmid) [Paraburkholderia sp. PREW-6R]|uniref:hypothetical protein n=1 Tax=Paraburkholderia sp. PREW-6R TaxID=3141544 RepID=UPI0031F596F6
MMSDVTNDSTTPEEDAKKALREGDSQKIDRVLDDLDVSTTSTGEDQTDKPDTEGSNSSSKNLDEQNADNSQGSSHSPD